MGLLIIVGAGALARDLIEIFGRDNFAAIYVDPGFAAEPIAGLPVVDNWVRARELGSEVVLGIADIAQRTRTMQQAVAGGLLPARPMVSAHAIVSASARIGPGCVVTHQAVIGPSVHLVCNVLIMHGVIVGHDSVIHNQGVICAGASIAGGVVLEDGCFVGPNAAIAPKVRIAAGSFLSAGSACLRSVPRRSVLIGNPARSVAPDANSCL